MKAFRAIFLILVAMISTTFAQTEEKGEMPDAPQAVKIVEFGKVPNGYIKMQLDNFFVELNNNPSAQGYIFNFGAAREIARVERVIRNQMKVRNFNPEQVAFISGGAAKKLQTQFWLVPAGAETPTPEYTEEPKSEEISRKIR